MPSIRSLRERVRSVESTRQITSSMKMVSTSKLRRMQNALGQLRPYADKCRELLSHVASGLVDPDSEFLKSREIRRTCFVLFLGNRGLCGNYNQALLHMAEGLMEQCPNECFSWICGKWGKERAKDPALRARRFFDNLPDTPTAADAAPLTEALKDLYLKGEADEVILVYQSYISVLQQRPTERRLLPFIVEETGESPAPAEVIFEPDREEILNGLVEQALDTGVAAALLESKAGEHAARLSAMTAATDNTDELIASLNLQLNHARQAAITTEISEITGGAAALNG